MSPRLERAALPKLLAHPAYRRHAKTEKLGNLASALASLVELENPPPHRDRNGSHGPTLSHNHVSVKLHHLWKCSRVTPDRRLRDEGICPAEHYTPRKEGGSSRSGFTEARLGASRGHQQDQSSGGRG